MAPRSDLWMDRETVAERRERILELTRRGWPAWQIADDLRLSMRTVQRHRDHARAGRPIGVALFSDRTRELTPAIRRLADQGMRAHSIGKTLKISPRTVRRVLEMNR